MEQELITLGILFFFALIGSILSTKFKQPVLMGLLVVGALIGPHMFGLINNADIMDMMISFGAILMLFTMGMQFDIPRLKKLGVKPVILATLNCGVMTFAGFGISMLLGFDVKTALFLGIILSFGSTVMIAKVLENKGLMDKKEVPLLIATLVVDDILAVIIITFFSGMKNKAIGILGSIEALVISVVLLIVAYALFIKFGRPALSWILKRHNNDEITAFTALALCAGFAYLAYYLKLSPTVGAFMAGSIVASLPNATSFQKSMSPYALIISSFFFIAIGTLVNFSSIIANIKIIAILVAVVVLLKMTLYTGMVYFFANIRGDRMFFLSIATFSVSEFSLLLAKESQSFNIGLDLISISAAIVAISAVIMSIAMNYVTKIYEPAMAGLPRKIKIKMESTSSYIQTVSEQLDLDNKHSQGLRNSMIKSFFGVIFALGIIFIWREVTIRITNLEALSLTSVYTMYITASILFGSSLLYAIINSKNASKHLSSIIANSTRTRNIVQSRKIVSIISSIAWMLIIVLSFPFIMFMFEMSKIYMIIPALLIILIVIQFRRFSSEADGSVDGTVNTHNFSKGFSSKEFNSGWKI
jgi:monovalent cation:H+ antiporter-2, CPA2 family